MFTVALVGADGAGKTTVARQVVSRLPCSRYLYMGVNLEASGIMLPSTRLALEVKRLMGGRSDMSAPRTDRDARGRGGLLGSVRTELRFANQIAEEWFRQLVAWYYVRRGTVVVFDRHFYWDYHQSLTSPAARAGMRGWHDRLLRRAYPRPDLVICLDAPAKVLFERKKEGTLEDREGRRDEYLRLGAVTDGFVVVSVDRPTDEVVADVVDVIERERAARMAAS
jgi:thymidylate kinase